MNQPSPQPSHGRGGSQCPGVKGHGRTNIPGAWYDAASRVDEARAVTSCALENMPTSSGVEWERCNNVAHLIAAVQVLLDLAKHDMEEIEQQLMSV